ncbi:hypothetical protein ABK040_009628 [Willaertia magna]
MPKSKVDPDMTHMTAKDGKFVYEYSEDTLLLTDAIQKDFLSYIDSNWKINNIDNNNNIDKNKLLFCLEIGSGSGYVSTYLYRFIQFNYLSIPKDLSFIFFCSDINPHATRMTYQTLKKNQLLLSPQPSLSSSPLLSSSSSLLEDHHEKPSAIVIPTLFDVVQCSFHSAFKNRLKNKIDVLIFNPPYVPSEEEEVGHEDIRAAYAGGEDGRKVIDVFLPMVKEILSEKGVFYFVVIEENKPEEIIEILSREEYGSFIGSVVLKKRILGEYLYILKFVRN